MKVFDFEWEKFDEFSLAIFDEISGLGFKRVLVVGVAEGGLPIGEHFANRLRADAGLLVNYSVVKCQRSSTKLKKSNPKKEELLRIVFRNTPRPVLNFLRVIEHYKLSRRLKADQDREVIANTELEQFSRSSDFILVVDDAVDSGASLKTVVDFIKKTALPGSIIKTLAVTVTQKNPLITPDYYLFSGVLVRFPWSLDAK